MGDVYMLNGKILSGLPNHAKDIIFDNTGTTLSSTNTEDAIKEVNSNLTWKLLDTIDNSNYQLAVAIPNDAIEICFDAQYQSVNLHNIVPRISLHAGLINWFSSRGREVGTYANVYGIGVQSFTYNGADCFANGGKVDIYYR